jgi:hypothetical protein
MTTAQTRKVKRKRGRGRDKMLGRDAGKYETINQAAQIGSDRKATALTIVSLFHDLDIMLAHYKVIFGRIEENVFGHSQDIAIDHHLFLLIFPPGRL